MRWRSLRTVTSSPAQLGPSLALKPLVDLASAFELLEKATDHYKITCDKGTFSVVTRVKSGFGKASGDNLARTITTAVVRGSDWTWTDERSDN